VKNYVKNTELGKKIFAVSPENFDALAIDLFKFQYQNNPVYRKYCEAIHININQVLTIEKIPFLPISFFKTHAVKTTPFKSDIIFESSGTTQTVLQSKHFVKDLNIYRSSFTNCFEKFYGLPKKNCVLGLLPSYLERKKSSLILMVKELMKASSNDLSNFYLYDYNKLHRTLMHNELLKIPTLLFGVTYALLDFAKQYPIQLKHTIVMETGGMKGRQEEITRQQVHIFLQNQLGVGKVHSEYGMTELLSQAYSKADGIFNCPNWMKILIREQDDPFNVITANHCVDKSITGVINIIDLANIYSCSFIATDDMGRLSYDESFEVLGRIDHSDLRGCSLLAI